MKLKQESIKRLKPSKIVLFDGECGICSKSVEFIFSIDRTDSIYFAPLNSPIAIKKLSQNGINHPNPNTFYYVDGDRLYSKSTGVLKVLQDTQSPYRYLYIFIIIPAFIRDFLYDLIAKNRHRLIKKSACSLPNPKLRQRILS